MAAECRASASQSNLRLGERASVVLVGEPGVGKTCVLRALRIPAAGFRLTYCHNATLGRRDFYRQLCVALGRSPAANAGSLFYAVSRHVEERAEERIHPVFLLDEAHLLHQDTLEHLHILLNYHWDSRALLSLVLVGLPELRDRLALRRNRSLLSRLHHRLEIAPLTPDDTAEYLRLRLRRAGCDRELFASDAIALLHEATAGAMRDLDRLAAAASARLRVVNASSLSATPSPASPRRTRASATADHLCRRPRHRARFLRRCDGHQHSGSRRTRCRWPSPPCRALATITMPIAQAALMPILGPASQHHGAARGRREPHRQEVPR